MGDKTDTKDINNTNDIQAPAEIMATPDITPVSIEKAETEPAAPLSPDEQMIQDGFNELLTDYLNSNHRRKVERITKAFNFANQAHVHLFGGRNDQICIRKIHQTFIAI